MLGRVGARRQLAFEHGLRQRNAVGDQPADGVDAHVEVVLDLVEVALVSVGDLGRDIAFRDAVHVLGRHVQGLDDRVQHPIETLHDGTVATLEHVGPRPLR